MKKAIKDAEHALREVARQNNATLKEVKKEIRLAMLAGLCNSDPAVQARWKDIPCAGEIPTPEELIAYIATMICGS